MKKIICTVLALLTLHTAYPMVRVNQVDLSAQQAAQRGLFDLLQQEGEIQVRDIERYLERGARTDQTLFMENHGLCTPLHIAILKDHTEASLYILQRGASAAIKTTHSNSNALVLACERANEEVCRQILRTQLAAIRDSLPHCLQLATDNDMGTIVGLLEDHGAAMPREEALHNRLCTLLRGNEVDLDELKVLISQDWTILDRHPIPLEIATTNGHLQACRVIISAASGWFRGCTMLKTVPSKALVRAAAEGNLPLCTLLANSGYANVNQEADGGNGYHTTPLKEACRNGCVDVVRFLLQKGAWHGKCIRYYGGLTYRVVEDTRSLPLVLAISNNHPDIVQILLETGISPSDMFDRYTPLIYAARLNRPSICSLLLRYQADVNQEIQERGLVPLDGFPYRVNFSALHVAAYFGYTEVCKELLKYGADIHKTTADGKTALALASEQGHIETCRTLIEDAHFIPSSLPSELAEAREAVGRGFNRIAALFGKNNYRALPVEIKNTIITYMAEMKEPLARLALDRIVHHRPINALYKSMVASGISLLRLQEVPKLIQNIDEQSLPEDIQNLFENEALLNEFGEKLHQTSTRLLNNLINPEGYDVINVAPREDHVPLISKIDPFLIGGMIVLCCSLGYLAFEIFNSYKNHQQAIEELKALVDEETTDFEKLGSAIGKLYLYMNHTPITYDDGDTLFSRAAKKGKTEVCRMLLFCNCKLTYADKQYLEILLPAA